MDEGDLAVLLQYNRNNRVVSLLSKIDSDIVVLRGYIRSGRLAGSVSAQFFVHLPPRVCSDLRRIPDYYRQHCRLGRK